MTIQKDYQILLYILAVYDNWSFWSHFLPWLNLLDQVKDGDTNVSIWFNIRGPHLQLEVSYRSSVVILKEIDSDNKHHIASILHSSYSCWWQIEVSSAIAAILLTRQQFNSVVCKWRILLRWPVSKLHNQQGSSEESWYFTLHGGTCPSSSKVLNITIVEEPCSHTIFQKSSMVTASGAWVAMNALAVL